MTYSLPPGVVGDGAANDTIALQAALDDGPVRLPNGTYRTTSTLTIPDKGLLLGESRENCKIVADDVTASAIRTAPGQSNQHIGRISVAGTADSGIRVDDSRHVHVHDIHVEATCEDGFVFKSTWGSQLRGLRTNGAAISRNCVSFGRDCNSNDVSLIYTSNNNCENNILFDNTDGSSGGGLSLNAITCQGGDIGLNVANLGRGPMVINGLYCENCALPVVLGGGGTIGTARVECLSIDGAYLGGPSSSHRKYEKRGPFIYMDYAIGVSLRNIKLNEDYNNSPEMDVIYYRDVAKVNMFNVVPRNPEDLPESQLIKAVAGASQNLGQSGWLQLPGSSVATTSWTFSEFKES